MNPQGKHYHPLLIGVHWLTLALMVAIYATIELRGIFPKGTPAYDGVRFHRVIPDFMIQCGDPLTRHGDRNDRWGTGGPGYRFEDELPQRGQYEIGSLAMANAGPNTNGSQFFIVSGPSGVGLPPSYSLFGKLISGLEVLEEIQKVQTDRSDRPGTDVVINSITIDES